MRMVAFSLRCARELLRDRLNLAFGLGFPLVLLILLSALQANIPVPLFEIHNLTPGISVFGLSFMTLFSATLVARDRESALLQRLYCTPMGGMDFILGYMLPLIPMALGQTAVCYLFAGFLGLELGIQVIYAILGILPMAVFNIALGLLCGSLLGVKQVGGICGALLTNLSAWLSGVWFDLELVGGIFETLAHGLPFYHGVQLERALLAADFPGAAGHFLIVGVYALLAALAAVGCFLSQMKKQ